MLIGLSSTKENDERQCFIDPSWPTEGKTEMNCNNSINAFLIRFIECVYHTNINYMTLGYKHTMAFRLGSSIYVKFWRYYDSR